MTDKTKAIELMQKWTHEAKELYPWISRVFLVGSWANGAPRNDSDYDLLVTWDDALIPQDIVEMLPEKTRKSLGTEHRKDVLYRRWAAAWLVLRDVRLRSVAWENYIDVFCEYDGATLMQFNVNTTSVPLYGLLDENAIDLETGKGIGELGQEAMQQYTTGQVASLAASSYNPPLGNFWLAR